MSAPDWRTEFARSIRYWFEDFQTGTLDGKARGAAGAVLDAIKAAGYRLHRDHDYGEEPDPMRRSLAYPSLALLCRRCGARNTDLGGTVSCEPREEP